MGRPRKPTKLLELQGRFKKNPAHRKDREHEPEPDGPLGDPPDHLDEAEQARWRDIRATAGEWLTIADRGLVEMTARLWMRDRRGETNTGDRRQLVQNWRLLGMTPSDRSNVQVPPKKDAPANPFDELVG